MRDIKANGEVRALIGAEKLRELHGDAFVRYECWQCGSTPSALAVGDGHRLGRRAGPAERRAVRIPSARRSLVARGG